MDQTIVTSPTQQKLLGLLGKGYTAAQSAQATGVTEGYVSQLMSEDWFAEKVQELRFLNLAKHQQLDEKYDDFEEEMLDKLKKMSKMLIKPMEIAKVLQIVNGAKRKSVTNTDPATLTQNIVQLNIPIAIANKFTTNANNQVVEVSDAKGRTQALVTVTSGQLEGLSREIRKTGEVEGLDIIDVGNNGGRVLETKESGTIEAKVPKTFNASSLDKLCRENISYELASKGLKESLRSTHKVTAEDL